MNCPIPNEHLIDRMIRALLGTIAALAGYFWLWGYWQLLVYVVALTLLGTAAVGYCHLYKLVGWNTAKRKTKISPKLIWAIFLIAFVGVTVGGSYASAFFSRKFFIEDFNRMNGPYKQTLFMTGQNNREAALSNYAALMAQFAAFSEKYTAYRPYILKNDPYFAADLKNVGDLITSLKPAVESGDLPQAHNEFEKVRPIFQDMLKRNGFSMLAVYLVDFHDAMEKVIAAADAKNPAGVLEAYAEADAKLKDVESAANDGEIQAIRGKLEEVASLAKQNKANELSAKAAELKSSFVKVYLQRG